MKYHNGGVLRNEQDSTLLVEAILATKAAIDMDGICPAGRSGYSDGWIINERHSGIEYLACIAENKVCRLIHLQVGEQRRG